MRRLPPKCALHRRRALVHLATDVGRDLMRQHVDDPDYAAARIAIGDDLHRGAVLLHALADDGIDQPPSRIVAIDQKLARHHAVGKRDDARIAIEPGVEHEAWHEPRMQRPKVAQGIPYFVCRRIDRNLLVNGSHGSILPDWDYRISSLAFSAMTVIITCTPPRHCCRRGRSGMRQSR